MFGRCAMRPPSVHGQAPNIFPRFQWRAVAPLDRNVRLGHCESSWHVVDHMPHAHRRSLRSTHARASAGLVLFVALAMLTLAAAGCGPRRTHTPPAVVAEAPPVKPEPYLLLSLSQRRVYLVDETGGR